MKFGLASVLFSKPRSFKLANVTLWKLAIYKTCTCPVQTVGQAGTYPGHDLVPQTWCRATATCFLPPLLSRAGKALTSRPFLVPRDMTVFRKCGAGNVHRGKRGDRGPVSEALETPRTVRGLSIAAPPPKNKIFSVFLFRYLSLSQLLSVALAISLSLSLSLSDILSLSLAGILSLAVAISLSLSL